MYKTPLVGVLDSSFLTLIKKWAPSWAVGGSGSEKGEKVLFLLISYYA